MDAPPTSAPRPVTRRPRLTRLQDVFRTAWRPAALLLTGLVLTTGTAGAAGYDLQFVNGVDATTGGTCAMTLNSRCRFNSVVVGAGTGSYQRDVVVTLTKLNSATLATAFDNAAPTLGTTATPTATATQFFAPTVLPTQTTANITGWAEFTFDFLTAGGAVPAVGAGAATLPGTIWVSSFDTDGDGGTLREFVEFVGGGITAADTAVGTGLSASTAVDGGIQYQGATAGQPNISTDNAYKGSAVYNNPSTFKLVYGARTGTSGSTAGGRLTAFDFFRPDAVLSRAIVDGYKSVRLTTDADGSGGVTPGDTLTYTLTYVNTGNASVTGLQIADPLPSGVTFTTAGQTVTAGTGSTASKNTAYTGSGANTGLLATGATLAANSTVTVTIPVVVGLAAANTTLSNQASATGTGMSATSSDNVDTTTTFPPSVTASAGWAAVPSGSVAQTQTAALDPTTVAVSKVSADLGVSKSGPAAVGSGAAVTYTLRVWNNGIGATSAATVSDTLPTGLAGATVTCAATGAATCGTQAISGGVLTATTGSLPVDAATTTGPDTIYLTYTVSATAPASGLLSNQATVTADTNTTTDATTANNTSATVTTRVVDAVNDAAVSFAYGAGGTVTVLGNDTVGGAAATTGNGAVTISNNGGLTGLSVSGGQLVVPSTAAAGTYTVTYSLCDAGVTTACDTATVPVTIQPQSLSGTVFVDTNYGGGAGRSLGTSAGLGRPGARVELYSNLGAFVASTTTDASGVYSFAVSSGTYTVRVVNSTVTPARTLNTGFSATGLSAVQTFRVSGGADDTARVGGENPALPDSGANTTGATLSSLTTATAAAQSVASVTVGTTSVSGVDFGFNFDTVVNRNDSGQGSLRQFILNSNALSNTGLAQVGQTAGSEVSIFMIPDGTARPGLRSGLASGLTGGVAVITPATALPAVTDANTVIDGRTQTNNVGDTNPGTLGAGGTVGVDKLALSTVNRPEVQIVSPNAGTASALASGLSVQANNVALRGLSVLGFGTAANSDGSANVLLGNNFTGDVIEGNFLGIAATRPSFDCKSGATAATGLGDNIRSLGADSGTVQNNLVGCAAGKGFGVENTSNTWTIVGNEIRGNGIGNANLDGIDFENGSAGNLARGNLVVDQEGVGVDGYNSGGANRIENNTVQGNGIGTATSLENAGVRLFGNGSAVYRNVIGGNGGAGVLVVTFNGVGATGNTISQNSIFGNGPTTGQIGIDLSSSTDNLKVGTAPFVTKNDGGDTDAGGNDLLNFPVFASAVIDAAGQNLTLTGFARPGSLIELFVAAPDPSGFGEGQTYLVSLTEGATAGTVDQDAGTGTYAGAAGTDTTNRFKFVVPLSGLTGAGAGAVLTATATCLSANGCTSATSGSTSEFSQVVTVIGLPLVTLTKEVRNCGPIASGAACPSSAAWGTTGTGKPGDVLEYRISYTNTGTGNAVGLNLADSVPANTTANLSGYAADKGLSWLSGTTTTLLTSATGDDAGSLTASQLLLNVGAVAPGAGGSVSFRAVIK